MSDGAAEPWGLWICIDSREKFPFIVVVSKPVCQYKLLMESWPPHLNSTLKRRASALYASYISLALGNLSTYL